jgi:aquaporin Z
MNKLIAEFIGTFTLIFIGVGAIAANHATNGALGLTGIALAHGLAIAVMVSATAATSGGHLNPAVTFGALVGGRMRPVSALAYIVAQCLGALFAAFMVKMAMPAAWLDAVSMGTPALGDGVTISQAFVMEVVMTFFLAFVVFGTAIDDRAHKVGGLFIGLTVALDIMAGGPVTGAAMNPARHFGPALLGGGTQNMWLYWVAPITGASLGALVYKHTLWPK